MQTSRRYMFFVFMILLVCATAYGQGTTAALTGTVTQSGSPLPGVTVTISSPAMQGTRTAVTSDNGTYSFPSLPPGEYTVSFELAGLQRVTRPTTLSLNRTSRVDAELRVSAVAESITVTASAPAVLETTQVAANFTAEQIDELPIGRTVRDTVLLAPGVNSNGPGNNVMISGAPAYDSVYLVNGVVVNENLRGQPHSLFIEDAIQETTIQTGGAISAEFGRFTGGVVSTLTKSGGNSFSGSLRDSLFNADWTELTPFVSASGVRQADPPDKINQIYEATLGGFILRDRLWFFGAGRRSRGVPLAGVNSTQRSTVFTNIQFENFNDEDRYEVKLTGRITDRHTLIGSYLDVKLDEVNNFFPAIGDEASIVPIRSLPNELKAIGYNGIWTNNLFIDAQYSEKFFAFQNSGGRFTDFVRGTWIQDLGRGFRYNAPVFCGVCTPEERNNESWVAKANYYLSTSALGSHALTFGVEDFFEERIANNFQSASQYQVTTGTTIINGRDIFPRFDAGTALIYRPILELTPGTNFATQSAFINDKWDLNPRFSFNVGLRYDKNDGKDASGNIVSNDSAFSPRLGLIYDINGDGRFRVNASYAKYVSKIADGNVGGVAQAAGNPAYFRYNYTGAAINPAGTPNDQLVPTAQALQMLFDWFQANGGFANFKPNATFVPGFGARFDEPIVSPNVDEFTVGFGTRIGSNAYGRVDLISREWGDFYAVQLDQTTGTIVDPFGNRGDVSVTVNDNSIVREYRGVQLQTGWNRGRWNIGGNYTWSELEGNDEGEQQGTATVRNQSLALYYPEYLNYANRIPEGYITGDQRHRAKAWVSFDQPTFIGNFNISLLQSFDSGQAYSAIGLIDASGRLAGNTFTGGPAQGSYTLSQIGTSHNYYFSERGAFRTDDRTSTDLALNYTLPIGRFNLFAQGELLNAFNEDAVVDLASSRINTTVITRRTGGAASGLVAFNPRTETPVEGVHYRLDPNFGKAASPDGYQTPRTYRFSLGLKF